MLSQGLELLGSMSWISGMSEPLPETKALSNEAPRKLDAEWKKEKQKNRKKPFDLYVLGLLRKCWIKIVDIFKYTRNFQQLFLINAKKSAFLSKNNHFSSFLYWNKVAIWHILDNILGLGAYISKSIFALKPWYWAGRFEYHELYNLNNFLSLLKG